MVCKVTPFWHIYSRKLCLLCKVGKQSRKCSSTSSLRAFDCCSTCKQSSAPPAAPAPEQKITEADHFKEWLLQWYAMLETILYKTSDWCAQRETTFFNLFLFIDIFACCAMCKQSSEPPAPPAPVQKISEAAGFKCICQSRFLTGLQNSKAFSQVHSPKLALLCKASIHSDNSFLSDLLTLCIQSSAPPAGSAPWQNV